MANIFDKNTEKVYNTKMDNKSLSKARKILSIDRYVGDVGVYDLSKKIKKGKTSYEFLLIARTQPASGRPRVTVWFSDETGVPKDEPIREFKGISIKEALKEMGYELI